MKTIIILKRTLLLTILLFSFGSMQAQYATYKVSKICYRDYDKGLEVFKDWSDWVEFGGVVISLSSTAMKMNFKSSGESEDVFKFVRDQPSDRWTFYKITRNEKNGVTATIYGNTSLQELLSGSFKGVIYFFMEYDDGSKANAGFKIE